MKKALIAILGIIYFSSPASVFANGTITHCTYGGSIFTGSGGWTGGDSGSTSGFTGTADYTYTSTNYAFMGGDSGPLTFTQDGSGISDCLESEGSVEYSITPDYIIAIAYPNVFHNFQILDDTLNSIFTDFSDTLNLEKISIGDLSSSADGTYFITTSLTNYQGDYKKVFYIRDGKFYENLNNSSSTSSTGYNGPNFQEFLFISGVLIFFISLGTWRFIFGGINK